MKCSAGILVAAALAISASPLSAQKKQYVPGEVLVMFEPDEITLPAGVDKAAAPAVGLRRQALRDLLGRKGLRSVKRVVSSRITAERDITGGPPVIGDPSVVGGPPIQALRKGEPVRPDALVDMSNLYLLRFADTEDVPALIAELEKLDGVVYAEANGYLGGHGVKVRPEPSPSPLLLRLAAAIHPNDPDYVAGKNWGFFDSANPGADVNAHDAWGIQTGNSTVRIAILDNGMDDAHPDVGGKVVAQHDFVDDDGDSHPDLDFENPFHGMSVGGIAAGRTNNGILSAGLCGGFGPSPGCSILDAKIRGNRGAFADPVVTSIEAIDWARANGAWVINNSVCMHSPFSSSHNALRNAYISGALITASMGNSDGTCGQNSITDVITPAAYNEILMAVGATTRLAQRASFSAVGSHISVVAPGVSHWAPRLNNTSNAFSGTSAAAPFVAGLAGLLFSESIAKGLQLNSSDIRQIIQLTATNLEVAGFDHNTGHGLINAGKALQVLQAPNKLAFGAIAPTTACTSITPLENWTFLASRAVVRARRCELRRTITFPQAYVTVPMVWGRSHINGGVTPGNPNSEVGFTDVIAGSVTTTGVTLRTYTYERWNLSGGYLGWYPAPPNQVTFAYAALGQPVPFAVFAGAPDYVTVKKTYPLNGSANYPASGWRWDRDDDGFAYTLWANAQNSQFVAYAGSYTINWRLFARRTSDGATNYGYASTTVCIGTTQCGGPVPLVLGDQAAPGDLVSPTSSGAAARPASTATALGRPTIRRPVGGHFGAGPWISRDGAAAAVQFYSLAGRHDGVVKADAWPNSFALSAGVAARRTVDRDNETISLSEVRQKPTSSVSTFRLASDRLKPGGGYRISYAIDPDLGVHPGDDKLTWIDSLGIVVVSDPDSGAMAYGWAASGNGTTVTLREYGSSVELRDPESSQDVYREQRAGSRPLGEPGDIRFALTLGPVATNAAGRLNLSFIAAQGKSPEEALSNLLSERRRTPSAAELAIDAGSSGAPRSFGLRQSLGHGGGPSFSASGTEGVTSLSARAQLRQFGITALEYAVAEGQSAEVRIRIYSRTGQLVRSLLREQKSAGEYYVEWDALNERGERVAPGVYVAVMEAGTFRATRKLVITR